MTGPGGDDAEFLGLATGYDDNVFVREVKVVPELFVLNFGVMKHWQGVNVSLSRRIQARRPNLLQPEDLRGESPPCS